MMSGYKYCFCKELWDIDFPVAKEGPVCPLLKNTLWWLQHWIIISLVVRPIADYKVNIRRYQLSARSSLTVHVSKGQNLIRQIIHFQELWSETIDQEIVVHFFRSSWILYYYFIVFLCLRPVLLVLAPIDQVTCDIILLLPGWCHHINLWLVRIEFYFPKEVCVWLLSFFMFMVSLLFLRCF